ncbi:MAG: DUF2877 domain-containing protein [Stellaceae bacterium]
MTAKRLEALTAGAGAESTSFSGTIHSVFARACNIEARPGRLLGLVAREIGAVPRGFQLATPDGFSFLDHVGAGAPVAGRAGLLRFDNSDLSIDLRPAKPWRSNLGRISLRRDKPGIAEAWRTAWVAVARNRAAEPFARQARDAIPALLRAEQSDDREAACAVVDRLVGLGDGLTPAGDDFLVGFLAGLWSWPLKDEPRRRFRAALADRVVAVSNRTGAISRHYLEAAAEGEVSQTLADLAAAIGKGDAKKTAGAVAAALAVGASSGAAASYGLLLAVRASEPVIRPATPPPKSDATRRSRK